MKHLDALQTTSALPYQDLVRHLYQIITRRDELGVQDVHRMSTPVGEGVLLLMPAAHRQFAILKTVTVHPGNAALGLPTIQGEVLAMSPTGQRLATLDGIAVTARRTAAISVLAAQHLAPRKAGSLLIIGAGTQAQSHLEAFTEAFAIEQVYIHSRSSSRAQALAEHARRLGKNATVVDDPAKVIQDVAFIVTATTSRTPVLPNWLPQNVFIAAVGAYTPEMCEIPPEVVRHCAVVVDVLEGAKVEAGDLLQAEVDWSQVKSLEDVLVNGFAAAPAVLFKSVGHALWDLAAAELALSQA